MMILTKKAICLTKSWILNTVLCMVTKSVRFAKIVFRMTMKTMMIVTMTKINPRNQKSIKKRRIVMKTKNRKSTKKMIAMKTKTNRNIKSQDATIKTTTMIVNP